MAPKKSKTGGGDNEGKTEFEKLCIATDTIARVKEEQSMVVSAHSSVRLSKFSV